MAARTPAPRTVVIDGTQYQPASITLKKGETVTFVNRDPFPHTVTAPGKFDSREIAADGKWSYRATTVGEFPYLCTLHPNMRGTLKVE